MTQQTTHDQDPVRVGSARQRCQQPVWLVNTKTGATVDCSGVLAICDPLFLNKVLHAHHSVDPMEVDYDYDFDDKMSDAKTQARLSMGSLAIRARKATDQAVRWTYDSDLSWTVAPTTPDGAAQQEDVLLQFIEKVRPWALLEPLVKHRYENPTSTYYSPAYKLPEPSNSTFNRAFALLVWILPNWDAKDLSGRVEEVMSGFVDDKGFTWQSVWAFRQAGFDYAEAVAALHSADPPSLADLEFLAAFQSRHVDLTNT